MSSKFPVLKLPNVPLFAILKSFSVGDLIVFLMLSKRAAGMVTDARISLGQFQISCSSKRDVNRISVGLEPNGNPTFEVIMRTHLAHFFEVDSNCFQFRRRKMQYKLMPANRYGEEERIEGYSEGSRVTLMLFAEYLLDVFPKSRITNLSVDIPYLRFVERFDKRTELLTIIDDNSASLEFPEIITTANVDIPDYTKLPIEAVASIRAPRVTLRPPERVYPYNGLQLQTFVRSWLASSDTVLESFHVPYYVPREWRHLAITDYVPTFPWNPEKRRRYWRRIDSEECWDCGGDDAYDVQREIGLLATILFHEDTFNFLVWHDSYLN